MKQPKVARTLGENTSIVILRTDSLIVSVGKKRAQGTNEN